VNPFLTASAQHIGRRAEQQDAFGFSDAGARRAAAGCQLVIVADGMGGHANGAEASTLAVETFLSEYRRKEPGEQAGTALEQCLRAANAAVHDLAARLGVPGNVGTTLTAAELGPQGLHWVSVGDSPLYLFRGGELVQLNTEHVYGRDLDSRQERGEIGIQEAADHPERESLTSYVGGSELGEVDRNLRALPLRPGDQVVLASDGLSKVLDESQIARAWKAGAEKAPQLLVGLVLQRQVRGQDNVTICLAGVPASAPKPAPLPLAHAAPEPPEQSPPPGPMRFYWLAAIIAALVAGIAGWKLMGPSRDASFGPSVSVPASGTQVREGESIAAEHVPPLEKRTAGAEPPAPPVEEVQKPR